ncbi:unnamed protein product [Ectocarpus sp. CCAP 1310/34]|nr:unnamed protein product [Ectocarpus sp. CCAP 1310/34]
MQLLPEEIVSRLPFRYFRQNGTSETLLDQVRATEGDLQLGCTLLVLLDFRCDKSDSTENSLVIRPMCLLLLAPLNMKTCRRILVAGEQGQELREMHWCIRFCVLSSSTGQGAHATRIHSQYGGQFLCMDGTWRIGLRVIDSPDCLFFLLGEDAKVHAYGAVQSERKEEIYLLLKKYAERRRRNGTLLALECLYDDLCCRGADDVTKGWIR